jgi:hypothetical protein
LRSRNGGVFGLQRGILREQRGCDPRLGEACCGRCRQLSEMAAGECAVHDRNLQLK